MTLTCVDEAELLAKEEILVFLAKVLLEETAQDSVVEMLLSGFKTLSSKFMLRTRLIELVIVDFDAGVFGDVGCFIKVVVAFKEIFSPAPHLDLKLEIGMEYGDVKVSLTTSLVWRAKKFRRGIT
jgi:hypothetical protein